MKYEPNNHCQATQASACLCFLLHMLMFCLNTSVRVKDDIHLETLILILHFLLLSPLQRKTWIAKALHVFPPREDLLRSFGLIKKQSQEIVSLTFQKHLCDSIPTKKHSLTTKDNKQNVKIWVFKCWLARFCYSWIQPGKFVSLCF